MPIGGAAPAFGGNLAAVKLGQILALLGLVLLVLGNLGRRRSRRGRQPPVAGFARWQRLSDLTALGLILAGLLLMWSQK